MNPRTGETKNPFTQGRVIGINTNPDVYHKSGSEDRGKAGHIMSRGSLFEFARCPQRWLNGVPEEESKAMEWGGLIDSLLLNPAAFEARYAVTPQEYQNEKGESKPWNWNANVCKAWRDSRAGREVVKFETHDLACKAVAAIHSDVKLRSLIGHSTHQVFCMATYIDDEIEIPVKVLLDIVPAINGPYGKCLADLKTASSAAPGPWKRSVIDHGYDVQAALYMDVYTAATGEDRTDWLHIVQESYEPFQTARWLLSAEFVELGRLKYTAALKRYAHCLRSNEWPGYEAGLPLVLNGWGVIQPDPWMYEV